jgi:hypothetical protein
LEQAAHLLEQAQAGKLCPVMGTGYPVVGTGLSREVRTDSTLVGTGLSREVRTDSPLVGTGLWRGNSDQRWEQAAHCPAFGTGLYRNYST